MDAQLRRAVNATLMPGFAGPTLPGWLADELADGLGAVCLFGSNIASPAQLRALTDAIHTAGPDAVIATDEEGGDVTRLHHRTGSPYPSMAYLGYVDDLVLTEAVGAGIGSELRAAGIDLNLAPDADVNADPRNPVIGVRSFGSDAALVARQVAAYTRGLQSAGVGAVAKHFPGHGDTATDSHLALPTVAADAATLAARDLPPFDAAVAAGTLAVMTSHIMVPALDAQWPATFSPAILGGFRRRTGFAGAIVSDALDMAGASGGRGIPEAAVLALAAGVDLLCLGSETTGEQVAAVREQVLAAVASGRLSADRVLDAAGRVDALSQGVRRLRAGSRGLSPSRPPIGEVSTSSTNEDHHSSQEAPSARSRRLSLSKPPTGEVSTSSTNEDEHSSQEAPSARSRWLSLSKPLTGEFSANSTSEDRRFPDAPVEIAADADRAPGPRSGSGDRADEPPLIDPAGFWRRGAAGPVVAPVLVRLASPASIAAGETPWGIAEHLAAELDAALPGATCVTVADLGALEAVLDEHPGRPFVVQGRDLNRVAFLREASAIVLRRRPDAVLVELGWPDFAGSVRLDVVTFGSGHGAALALIRLLAEGAR